MSLFSLFRLLAGNVCSVALIYSRGEYVTECRGKTCKLSSYWRRSLPMSWKAKTSCASGQRNAGQVQGPSRNVFQRLLATSYEIFSLSGTFQLPAISCSKQRYVCYLALPYTFVSCSYGLWSWTHKRMLRFPSAGKRLECGRAKSPVHPVGEWRQNA